MDMNVFIIRKKLLDYSKSSCYNQPIVTSKNFANQVKGGNYVPPWVRKRGYYYKTDISTFRLLIAPLARGALLKERS